MITLEQKKQLQIDAGIPHLPTDLTYECRMAISGEGSRAYDWRDKPHRLVYDLSRQVEADADRIEQLAATCEQLERERDEIWDAAITAAADACTSIIKNYDCMKSDGETYQPMWVQKVAKGMVDIARQDIHDLKRARAVLAELEGGE